MKLKTKLKSFSKLTRIDKITFITLLVTFIYSIFFAVKLIQFYFLLQ